MRKCLHFDLQKHGKTSLNSKLNHILCPPKNAIRRESRGKKRRVKVAKYNWRSLVEVSPRDNHRHPPSGLKPTAHNATPPVTSPSYRTRLRNFLRAWAQISCRVTHTARLQVLTAMLFDIQVFWDVTPCRLANSYRRFGRSWFLRLQGQTVQKDCLILNTTALRHFETSNRHDVTSQKTRIFCKYSFTLLVPKKTTYVLTPMRNSFPKTRPPPPVCQYL